MWDNTQPYVTPASGIEYTHSSSILGHFTHIGAHTIKTAGMHKDKYNQNALKEIKNFNKKMSIKTD